MNGEVVDLAEVIAPAALRVSMMAVAANRVENDASAAKSPGLALNARKTGTVIDHQVIPSVLPERK
jgi:hypothetical protein